MNYPAYDARIFHDEDENALDVFAPYIVALKLGMKLLVKKGYVTDYDDDDMEHDENNQAVGNQPGGQAGGSNDSKDCWFAFEMAPPPPLRRPFLRLDNNQNGTDGDDGTDADDKKLMPTMQTTMKAVMMTTTMNFPKKLTATLPWVG